MVFVGTMRKEEEIEPLTFTRIGLHAARVVDRLDSDEQQNKDRGGNRKTECHREKEEKQHREYVDHRLREIRSWERRISGRE
ncbi:hypothetical protein [Afipia carboxidovorans]|uniref:hypothetical protein n=1 Tax=Afipia carboxidovorans TaxID=40137 RepID=UPI0030876F98|nr:hypothetical protein CRBSH125_35020 [Afipia carboxidovorans]